jgi:hypothetical protein
MLLPFWTKWNSNQTILSLICRTWRQRFKYIYWLLLIEVPARPWIILGFMLNLFQNVCYPEKFQGKRSVPIFPINKKTAITSFCKIGDALHP